MSFRPKKSLGQHFLTDPNIIRKISEASSAGSGDRVIEIGPGTGALTEALYEKFDKLEVIELDRRAIEVIEEKFPGITIHHQNILDVRWEDLSMKEKSLYVYGNLPYYITSQILFSLLEARTYIVEAILMMQKEVAERLVAPIRTKEYGILSVQVRLMSTPELSFDVSRNCFNPPPNVDSTVVKIAFDKGELSCSDSNLKKVVRTAFNQRRKKLSNALKPLLGKNLPEGFDFDKRAEAWPPEEYEKLTALLEHDGILT